MLVEGCKCRMMKLRSCFQTKTYYLCDAGTQRHIYPYVVAAKTIVFSSPDKRNYQDYQKPSKPRVVHMPVWALDELKKVIDRAQAEAHYNVWGGIPCYVMDKTCPQTPLKMQLHYCSQTIFDNWNIDSTMWE